MQSVRSCGIYSYFYPKNTNFNMSRSLCKHRAEVLIIVFYGARRRLFRKPVIFNIYECGIFGGRKSTCYGSRGT